MQKSVKWFEQFAEISQRYDFSKKAGFREYIWVSEQMFGKLVAITHDTATGLTQPSQKNDATH
jgi:hypothetical protein